MITAIRRWWRYLGTKLGMALESSADPRVELEQAIAEARDQHRLLTEQAANIIAGQTQLQVRLDRAIEEYGRTNAAARQAVMLADQASIAGDTAKAAAMTVAAEGFVSRTIALEGDIDGLRRLLLDAAAAAERARRAVAISSAALRKRLVEREALLSRLDQAKMQEQMNVAMAQLTATVGGDAPTLDDVRAKIDHRLAVAQAMTEVRGASVDMQMLELGQAQRQAETEARLAGLRAELGVSVGPIARPALAPPGRGDDVVVGAEPEGVASGRGA